MKNIDIKNIAAMHATLSTTNETDLSLVDFIQYYVDQYKDDWHMYRPIVEQLEITVTELERKLESLEQAGFTFDLK